MSLLLHTESLNRHSSTSNIFTPLQSARQLLFLQFLCGSYQNGQIKVVTLQMLHQLLKETKHCSRLGHICSPLLFSFKRIAYCGIEKTAGTRNASSNQKAVNILHLSCFNSWHIPVTDLKQAGSLQGNISDTPGLTSANCHSLESHRL